MMKMFIKYINQINLERGSFIFNSTVNNYIIACNIYINDFQRLLII